MSLSQFIVLLRARYKIVLITMFLVVFVALGISLILPKTYKATATVLVNYKGADPVTGIAMPSQLLPGYMATQVDIIASKNVAKKVIDELKLTENEAIQQSYQDATEGRGSINDWLAELLLKSLDVQPSKESSLIDISFKGNSAQFSAVLANAFANAYLEKSIALKVEPSRKAAQYFDEQLKVMRERLQLAQERLSEYQQSKGIVSLDDRLDVERARLNDLSSQLVVAQSQLMEAQSRQRGAVGDAMQDSPDIASNPIIQSLKTEIARAESKFADISQKYERNHPSYRGAKAEIDNLKAELSKQVRAVSGNVVSTSKILHSRESELQSALTAQKNKVLALNRERDELLMRSREVENAQKIYEISLQRYASNDLEAQSNQSEVVLLNAASPPLDPASPKIFLNIIVAIFMGMILGVGFALLLEILDRRVRAPDDLFLATKAPFLGIFEGKKSKRRMFLSSNVTHKLLK